ALDPVPNDYYCWLRIEVDEPEEFYFRYGGQWIGPVPIQGEQGIPGEGLNPAGQWNSSTTYSKNDYVYHNSYSFVSRVDDNLNHTPPSTATSNTYWQYVPSVGGSGNVNTTGSVANNRLVRYSGTTGNIIADAGVLVSDLATAAQGAKAD